MEHKYVRKDYNLSYHILYNWDSHLWKETPDPVFCRLVPMVQLYATQEVTIFATSQWLL